MLKRFAKDIKKYFRYSIVSAKCQLKCEVADSYLNWIWWILEPLCFMLVYSYVFGTVFKAKEQYFSAYIFIGLSMWNFFSRMVQGSVHAIRSNKSIVSRVYFPKYILLMTKTWVNGFKLLVSFAIVGVMIIVFRIPLSWNVLYAIPITLVLAIFTFGCSCFFMHWGVYINDLGKAVKILMKMLFYITGVLYNLEKRIPNIGVHMNRYNPIAFLLTSMRQCLIYSQAPDIPMLVFWCAIGFILSLLGIFLIYRKENNYVKSI